MLGAFSNQCPFYKVVKVVHRNQWDNHYNQSDAWWSTLELY